MAQDHSYRRIINELCAEENEEITKPDELAARHRMLPKALRVIDGQTMLTENQMLRNRWHILGLIGHGGYGQIFVALDLATRMRVAIKVEPKKRKGKDGKRMMLEQEVLCRLQGRPHVPLMHASGNESDMNFIVLQLLSKNLAELRKASPVGRLSPSTVARIMMQGVAALRDMHTAHYLHRDVKPGNMCFGLGPNARHILKLFDFGMARKFKSSDGQLIPRRNRAGFRGTPRYVSTRVHARMEQSPADDLVSMAYSGLELLLSSLPWKFTAKSADILNEKQELEDFGPTSMLKAVPEPMQNFCLAVFSLLQTDEPNYSLIQDLLFDMTDGLNLSDPYDWNEDLKWEECQCRQHTAVPQNNMV